MVMFSISILWNESLILQNKNKMKIWILIKTQPVDFPIKLKSNKNFYPGSPQLPTPGRQIPPFAGSAQSFAKV